MFYIKTPETVEAFQWTRENAENSSSWPTWLKEAYKDRIVDAVNKGIGSFFSQGKMIVTWHLHNKTGVHEVKLNDWIIKRNNGELYTCSFDTFGDEYEKVPEGKEVS